MRGFKFPGPIFRYHIMVAELLVHCGKITKNYFYFKRKISTWLFDIHLIPQRLDFFPVNSKLFALPLSSCLRVLFQRKCLAFGISNRSE